MHNPVSPIPATVALTLALLLLATLPGRAQDTFTEPITGMKFVRVPSGCFEIGCGSWATDCFPDEKPATEVCLDEFWMGKYEVTQGQWKAIMGHNPSHFQKGDNYPVENVSWDDAQEYIRKLNSRDENYEFRLPTEAEWEYACRSGGKNQRYCGGDILDDLAWHVGNSGGSTHPVGLKKKNDAGLFDMTGNVREWTADGYNKTAYLNYNKNKSRLTYITQNSKVLRGGSYDILSRISMRSIHRNKYNKIYKHNFSGIRIATDSIFYDIDYAIQRFNENDYFNSFNIFKIFAIKNNPIAQFYLGLMHAEGNGTKKDFNTGVQYLIKAAGQGHHEAKQKLREYIPVLLMDAEKKLKSGDIVGSRVALDSVQSVDLKSIPAHALLGRVYLEQGNYDEAEITFENALELLQGSCDEQQAVCGEIWTRLALTRMAQGKREKALETLREFRNQLPAAAEESRTMECWLLLSNREEAEALECFTQTQQNGKETGLTSLGMAHAHFLLREYAQAEESLGKVTSAGLQAEADSQVLTYCPQCLEPALDTAAVLGVPLEVGPLNNQEQLARAQTYAIAYLKSDQFLTIAGKQHWVFRDEALLVDPESGKAIFPYAGIALPADDLTAGNSVEVSGEHRETGNTIDFTLRLLADFVPRRIEVDGAELDLAGMNVGRVALFPKLRREYKISFAIRKDRSTGSRNLNILTEDGRTHEFIFEFDGQQVSIQRQSQTPMP